MTAAYRYRAATAEGAVVEGVVRAGSPRAAMDELRRQTLMPVSVEPVAERRAMRATRMSRRDAVAASIRTIASLLGAGIPLERALSFAESQAARPDLAAALSAVRADVQSGTGIADSMRRQELFGSLAGAIIRAGEESGTLDDAMARLADHLEQTNELMSQLRGALLYPMLMGIVAGAGVLMLLAFVIPRFVRMLADVGGTLPLSTRALVGVSTAFTRGWWLWLPLSALLTWGARRWLREPSNRARWHAARLGLPVVGELEMKLAAARFARAFGVLLRAGTPALPSLRLAREAVSNAALGARVERAATAVARGDRIAASLDGALPPLAVQLLAAGEESGSLDAMSERVAQMYDAEVQRSLRTLVRLVEPALILLFGVVVGFIALAMLQAMYSINAGL